MTGWGDYFLACRGSHVDYHRKVGDTALETTWWVYILTYIEGTDFALPVARL